MAMQKECTADDTGESGASASLAMKEAVAPRTLLRRARLLMDIQHFVVQFSRLDSTKNGIRRNRIDKGNEEQAGADRWQERDMLRGGGLLD